MRRLSTAAALGSLVIVAAAAAAPAPPRDRVPPTTPTIDGQLRTNSLRPVFTFGARDTRTPRGKLRFRCSIDLDRLHPCARIHRPADALDFGLHTLRVRALDRAGNLSRTGVLSFRVLGRWDAGADFERAPRPANPGRDRYGNTTWSYLYSPTRSHDPAGYQILPTFAVLAPGWEVWHRLPDFQSASGGFINGKTVMHPGPSFPEGEGENAVLGWRSPIEDTVRIDAQIENEAARTCPVAGNGIRWSIDQGATTLRSGTVQPGSSIESLGLTVKVTVGESLYLVIEDNGSTNCDSTGIALLIYTG